MKIRLRSIPIKNLRPYLNYGWSGDDELLQYAHKPHADLAECIMVNFQTICQASTEYRIECYAAFLDTCELGEQDHRGGCEIPIGFAVFMYHQGETVLYSFGINKNHREKEKLTAWLAAIEEKVGRNYIVSLYSVNSRAVRFFERNGFVNKKESDSHVFLWQSTER